MADVRLDSVFIDARVLENLKGYSVKSPLIKGLGIAVEPRAKMRLKVINRLNEPIESALCEVLDGAFPPNVLSFDGVDDYINLPYTNIIGSAFTFEILIKGQPPGASTYKRIAELTVNSSNTVQFVGANTTTGNPGKAQFIIVAGGTTRGVSSNSPIGNDWCWLAGTWNGSNAVQLYVNGSPQTGAAIGGAGAGTASRFNIARRSDALAATYYQGLISEIRLWNSVLTQQQINDNMNRRVAGNESGLIRCYPVMEGSGSDVNELVSSQNGTIFGAQWAYDADLPILEGGGTLVYTDVYDSATTNANGLVTLDYKIDQLHGLKITINGKRNFIMPFRRENYSLLDWQVKLDHLLASFITDGGKVLVNGNPYNNDNNLLLDIQR